MDLYDKKTGSILGGALLIAGSCIGGGMLGVPVLSASAGFLPSLLMFLISWIFMTTAGLLLLEVNLWYSDEISIISMASRTLGKAGRTAGWILYLFLFYSLMVAYIVGTTELFTHYLEDNYNIILHKWAGSLPMMALFALLIYLGTHAVDKFNRLLMLGLVLSYVLLVMIGGPHVNTSYLDYIDWKAAFYVMPIMVISFGFHNLIPSLKHYFNGDANRLKKTIILGSTIALILYVIWEWLILGLVPLAHFKDAINHGEMATETLKNATGKSMIVISAQYFAFFAIVTSFLGVALSLVDFLADGLKIKKNRNGKLLLCNVTLLPPFIFSLFDPHIFLTALSFAGGFGAVLLFGILPALMVWEGRYWQKIKKIRMVPGGKPVLICMILFSSTIFIIELIQAIRKL